MKSELSESGLQRFIDAQDQVYDAVCAELARGRKTTHWIWFIFPQLRGLGRSAMARHFGVTSRAEALAYWQHPVLRMRLVHCTQLLLTHPNLNAHAIFGSTDELKLRSCLTLFSQVAPEEPVFAQALERFYQGQPDDATLVLLQQMDWG